MAAAAVAEKEEGGLHLQDSWYAVDETKLEQIRRDKEWMSE